MSVVLYWLAIRFYSLGVRVASLFNNKAKLFVRGRVQLLNHIRYSLVDEKRPRIWMHCASLGEFEQGRPVLEKLREKYPTHAVVLTFFSPSGYEVRRNYVGANYVFYLPLDSNYNAWHFIESVKPSLAVFVKYDLWYFFLMRLKGAQIPTLLVSAIFRQGQAFFKWYGSLHIKMLQAFTHIFVQDEASVKMLEKIGVDNVSVGGDTRFDRVVANANTSRRIENIEKFCEDHKLIVAGSTWKEDEVILKQVHDSLSNNWKLIIAPHEIHTKHIIEILEQYEGEAVLWSEFEKDYYDQKILVIDSIGILSRIYKYADVAYIGGGFNKSGIHNLLEAAVFGKPLFHGPNYDKFKEAKELLSKGASSVVEHAATMSQQIIDWEKDRLSYNAACISAKTYVSKNTGATQKVVDYVEEKLLINTL